LLQISKFGKHFYLSLGALALRWHCAGMVLVLFCVLVGVLRSMAVDKASAWFA